MKVLILKLSKLLKRVYRKCKIAFGIKEINGVVDYTVLIEAAFIWLIGTPIILLIAPNFYNPVAWLVIILMSLILANIEGILEK